MTSSTALGCAPSRSGRDVTRDDILHGRPRSLVRRGRRPRPRRATSPSRPLWPHPQLHPPPQPHPLPLLTASSGEQSPHGHPRGLTGGGKDTPAASPWPPPLRRHPRSPSPAATTSIATTYPTPPPTPDCATSSTETAWRPSRGIVCGGVPPAPLPSSPRCGLVGSIVPRAPRPQRRPTAVPLMWRGALPPICAGEECPPSQAHARSQRRRPCVCFMRACPASSASRATVAHRPRVRGVTAVAPKLTKRRRDYKKTQLQQKSGGRTSPMSSQVRDAGAEARGEGLGLHF